MTGESEGSSCAADLISTAVQRLQMVQEYDESLQELEKQLSEIESLLSDFNREMSGYLGDLTLMIMNLSRSRNGWMRSTA